MAEYLPTPERVEDTDRSGPQDNFRRPRRGTAIPTVEEIQQMLLKLNGAVTLGVISTKEANVIHRNLKTILDVQLKRGGRQEGSPTHEALVDLCRREPNILNAIEPFLTDQQVDWLVEEISGDPDGPV
jgi:hypothetical protein